MDRTLAEAIGTALGSTVRANRRVHGGDVAAAYCVDLHDGRRVFAKTLLPRAGVPPPAGFFTTESTSLSWLAAAGTVDVPDVLAVSDGAPAFLALSWIDRGVAGPTTDADLGRGLAGLHRAGPPCFGREDRHTTGSRGLPNEPMATWVEFYATCRILPLARLARQSRALSEQTVSQLETLATRLERFAGPAEPPARLHGDLWGGNRLVGADGRSWLIDPAAFGGHREFDLAMMRLFGGFEPSCFAAYDEVFPLADGWPERIALHQIAPLVVHAIKFGGGYVHEAATAISRYVG